ncbi:MAG TPA: hypothetical protein VFV32_03120 [Acidimicrobiales bacterium]|nr:hypothetical protein [Acidimicrobiales bacterium]
MRRLSRTGAVLAAVVAAVGLWGGPGGAQGVDVDQVGEAVVTAAGQRIDGGGSATPFSLRLPGRAECPGDTAFEYWIVHSFMVPSSVDVTEIEFSGLGPDPLAFGDPATFRQPLYEEETTGSWVAVATGAVERKGEPGPIINVPTFSFGVFEPGMVPPGDYHIGLACVLGRKVGPVWSADITITADPQDEPGGFRWTVVPDSTEADRGSSATPVVAAFGAAVLAAGLVKHRRRATTTPRE